MLSKVPGDPYPVENVSLPAPAPHHPFDNSTAGEVDRKTHAPYVWIVGGLGLGLALIVLSVVVCICLRHRAALLIPEEMLKILMARIIISFRFFGSQVSVVLQEGTSAAALGTNVFDPEKPVISHMMKFVTQLMGSLMQVFLAMEHMVLFIMVSFVTRELIGYAATDDELFLIYEYAQKGSLRSHLHDPQNKGHTFLSWIMRVQIALDAARGLEYIHEHTKTHYVHRDIKTSNILLDGAFRAKVLAYYIF
ncbi:hypothetical protein LWI28_014515 [Acer negundo]|uniref:Protein kinase domain-containing protein n=1 Tax=Acer negundo TaxID=4023 RepID=A0AAD5J953_ACENE|nr:hypothetical protein LWI28_014515 [Acer negundo]